MNLELRKVQIKDIVFDTEDKIVDGVLHVDPKKLEELVLEDSKVKSVSFDIARPGESVRIVPVKDVIEPRAKLEGGEVFPGLFKEDMQEAETGTCGTFKITWKPQTRRSFQPEAFANDNPNLDLSPYYKETVSRVFRITNKQ